MIIVFMLRINKAKYNDQKLYQIKFYFFFFWMKYEYKIKRQQSLRHHERVFHKFLYNDFKIKISSLASKHLNTYPN